MYMKSACKNQRLWACSCQENDNREFQRARPKGQQQDPILGFQTGEIQETLQLQHPSFTKSNTSHFTQLEQPSPWQPSTNKGSTKLTNKIHILLTQIKLVTHEFLSSCIQVARLSSCFFVKTHLGTFLYFDNFKIATMSLFGR